MLEAKGGCSGKVRACHVDYAGDKGIGTKVADEHAVPMCDGHHGQQHAWGWKSFEANYRINPSTLEAAAAYWRAWPGRGAWLARRGVDLDDVAEDDA